MTNLTIECLEIEFLEENLQSKENNYSQRLFQKLCGSKFLISKKDLKELKKEVI